MTRSSWLRVVRRGGIADRVLIRADLCLGTVLTDRVLAIADSKPTPTWVLATFGWFFNA